MKHALSSPKGGLPSIRHNEISDLTAKLLTEVCLQVATELALKQEIHYENRRRSEESAASLHSLFSNELQHARELACLKGASSWLTVLPLNEHNFSLYKSDFCDAVCLRYGWPLPHL